MPIGKRVWESGYVDSNGDFADVHSLDLAAGKIEYDDQLFNLQGTFLVTMVLMVQLEQLPPTTPWLEQAKLIINRLLFGGYLLCCVIGIV